MYTPLSQHVDQECLFMGLVYPDGRPLDVPREVINEHVYICGQTGTGKTSLAILTLLMQLARSWNKASRDPNDRLVRTADGKTVFEKQERPPILIFDLKGEPALFNSARMQAKEAGYEFKFFSFDQGRPGYIFDVFQNLEGLPPLQLSETILQALSLVHGPGYGRSYYSGGHRTLLTETLADKAATPNWTWTWEKLFKQTGLISRKPDLRNLVKDSAELRNDLYAIKQHGFLSAAGREPRNIGVIHMPTVLEERQMIYCWLPTSAGETSSNEIAKLALYAFERAAKQRADSGRRVQSYVFIDEFHRVLGRNLEQLFTQDRSYGISYILSNQYPARLSEEDLDIRRMVYEATRVKQYFTLSDPNEIQEIETASGQTKRLLGSSSTGYSVSSSAMGTTVTQSSSSGTHEVLSPRFDRDFARQITEDPVGSLVWIQRGKGEAKFGGVPQWVQSLWPIEMWQWKRRDSFLHFPWPHPKDDPPPTGAGVPTAPLPVPTNPAPPPAAPSATSRMGDDADAKMRTLFEKNKKKGNGKVVFPPKKEPKKPKPKQQEGEG